jgi:hypothetical protein
MDHIGADPGGVVAPPRIQSTIAILHAGIAFFGLGVSKQHQAHGNSIDFCGVAV